MGAALDKAEVVAKVCMLAGKDRASAAKMLEEHYPFSPSRPIRKGFSQRTSFAVFKRDGFVDRYSGRKLVHPGALRVLAEVFPDKFPYHPHGRRDLSHVAFWELFPTVDHILPLAQGGQHEESNFATTSMLLNLAKKEFNIGAGWLVAS